MRRRQSRREKNSGRMGPNTVIKHLHPHIMQRCLRQILANANSNHVSTLNVPVHKNVVTTMLKLSVLFILCCCLQVQNSSADYINIGGIFEQINSTKEFAFRLAIKNIAIEKFQSLTLAYKLEHIEKGDLLQAIHATCTLLSEAVVGIFGPESEENSNGILSVCDAKEIPVIETRWDSQQQRSDTVVNLYPHATVLAKVFVDIVKTWNWKSFTILYEDNESLIKISELLKMYDNNGHTVILRQLDKNQTGNYRPTLKEVWRSGHTHFVLDCSIDILEEVLRQAQQIGLTTNNHNYVITNLDLQTIDLSPYQYSETNITGVRMVDPTNEKVKSFADEIDKLAKELSPDAEDYEPESMQIETALIIDAVHLFATALDELNLDQQFSVPLFCNNTDNWEHGTSIINFMRMNAFDGLTGFVKFDHEGFRSDISLDVIELTEDGIQKVANWTTTDGLIVTRVFPEPEQGDYVSLRNRTFKVVTCLTDPYGMLRQSQVQLTGNDQYEGFGIDLIHELSLLEGFNYTFIIREDKNNGEYKNGSWTGMIGDLINYSADLAITDLTITQQRESAVDFTPRFMNLGVGILYKKPAKAPPDFFSFADPFALEVWLLLGTAYFGVSFSLFVMGRLCPSEWNNPFPCVEEPEHLINQFSLRNSFWFAIGSLLQQGSEIAPIAVATRIVAGLWWFFTLIMVSSYTANLAAFLTMEPTESPFSTIRELAERAERLGIKCGTKSGGSTLQFLEQSTKPELKTIFYYMNNHTDFLVNENKVGVKRAADPNEKYAFFMESTSIEYEIQRECSLMQVGQKLDEKGYGIAMRKNSTYRNTLNTALLKLLESGKIADLKRKWWEERRGGGQCSNAPTSQEAPPLNLRNVQGVFVVSVAGIAIATVLVVVELLIFVVKKSHKDKTSFKAELMKELKFYFKFKSMTKPVGEKSPTPSPNNSEKAENDEEMN